MIRILICILILSPASACFAAGAVRADSDLYQKIAQLDALLFDQAFNQCRFDGLAAIIADDLEFYHDESGLMTGKAALINSFENGICSLDYKATRRLIEGSMQVFPLKRNGELYGAIQQGEHNFYAQYGNGEPEKTSTAKFTHVWVLHQGQWKLSRILSYAHQ